MPVLLSHEKIITYYSFFAILFLNSAKGPDKSPVALQSTHGPALYQGQAL